MLEHGRVHHYARKISVGSPLSLELGELCERWGRTYRKAVKDSPERGVRNMAWEEQKMVGYSCTSSYIFCIYELGLHSIVEVQVTEHCLSLNTLFFFIHTIAIYISQFAIEGLFFCSSTWFRLLRLFKIANTGETRFRVWRAKEKLTQHAGSFECLG